MESIALLFFLLQQLGMTLGVGSSTFALMFYIVGASDGVIDASERRFMHAVYTTLRIGLFLILISGMAITAAHYFAGDLATVASPAYLFKWLLLFIIIANAVLMDRHILPAQIGGVVAGGSWYALFIIHTLAPEVVWASLLILYALWLVIFWAGFTLLRKLAVRAYASEGSAHTPPQPSRSISLPSTAVSPASPATKAPHIEFTLPSSSPQGTGAKPN